MPSALKGGVIELLTEYTVCKEGEILTPEQAKLLVLFPSSLSRARILEKKQNSV
jgi:mRNA turnover protein 4